MMVVTSRPQIDFDFELLDHDFLPQLRHVKLAESCHAFRINLPVKPNQTKEACLDWPGGYLSIPSSSRAAQPP